LSTTATSPAEVHALPGRTRSLKEQGVAFVVVGTATASLDYLTLYLLTEFAGCEYFLSAAIGFMLGSTTNYFLSIRWVFAQGHYRQRTEFSFFILTSLAGLALNQFMMWLCVDWFAIHYLVSKLLAIVVVTAWNFVVKKKLVFSN
jgi:putative flippase GtrA